jgi:hypothetical protein
MQAWATGYALRSYYGPVNQANMYRVHTSQGTHYVCVTKPNRLTLFRETVAVCCENHTENTNTLRGRCVQFVQCYEMLTGNFILMCCFRP